MKITYKNHKRIQLSPVKIAIKPNPFFTFNHLFKAKRYEVLNYHFIREILNVGAVTVSQNNPSGKSEREEFFEIEKKWRKFIWKSEKNLDEKKIFDFKWLCN